MMKLDWQSVCSSNNPKFMVKGTELAVALPAGFHNRFQISEVRAYDADRHSTVIYYVRDASTVSDADVRDGKRSKVVFHAFDLDKVEEWLKDQKQ